MNKNYFLIIFLVFIALVRVLSACAFLQSNNEMLIKCKEMPLLNKGNLKSLKNTDKVRQDYINSAEHLVYKNLTKTQGHLVMGMVLGVDNFSQDLEFKKILKRTGTIHVVVVSGFNITLVYNFLISILKYINKQSFFISFIFVLFYCFLVGFSPPVVRAVIMSSIFIYSKRLGRNSVTGFIFIVTLLLSLILKPEYLTSLSFQLSFLATYGLIVFAEKISIRITRILNFKHIIIEDFSATCAAQILVIPILSYYFGSISLISFLANTIVLWTVPIITVLGFILVILGNVSHFIEYIISFLLNILLTYFIGVLEFLSKFKYSELNIELSFNQMLVWYLIITIIIFGINNIKLKTLISDKIGIYEKSVS